MSGKVYSASGESGPRSSGDFRAGLIRVARGREPAEVVLKNARVVNVFSGEVLPADVALQGGYIAGVGSYDEAREIFDLQGRHVLPGFIDGHVHIESSMLTPEGFAESVSVHGTTAVVADPHEIVNVCGLAGFRYMVEAAAGLPLDFFYTVPSCVPATMMETAGADFTIGEMAEAWRLHPLSPALGEMMNFPGVIEALPEVLDKLNLAAAHGLPVDGHAPLLSGRDLNAYCAAGISTDHEATTAEEALEKLRLGLCIAIREGSAAANLADLLPAVNDHNYGRFFFCCDDQNPHDLLQGGHIAAILRRSVHLGLNPLRAVQLATLNPARHYGLKQRGAVAPGYLADLVVVRDLEDFRAEMVFKNGVLVARNGSLLQALPRRSSSTVTGSVRLPPLGEEHFLPPAPQGGTGGDETCRARVIEVVPGQIITRCREMTARELATDKEVSLVAVVERHGRGGGLGRGYVRGFGSLRGALASTVAHDSHNLVLVGSDPRYLLKAAALLRDSGGGLAVVGAGTDQAVLPLPVAGLMSTGSAAEVAAGLKELHRAAAAIGCVLEDPFMTMAFLSLAVIPSLKITDHGLVDVEAFRIVELWQCS